MVRHRGVGDLGERERLVDPAGQRQLAAEQTGGRGEVRIDGPHQIELRDSLGDASDAVQRHRPIDPAEQVERFAATAGSRLASDSA